MSAQTSTPHALNVLTSVLDAADVTREVFELRPECTVMLLDAAEAAVEPEQPGGAHAPKRFGPAQGESAHP